MPNNPTIRPYPIKNVAHLPIEASDWALAAALLESVDSHHQHLRGRRVWLACSGGRDSQALAAMCVQLYQLGRLPFLPCLLHVDHGLQAHSTIWATHVAAWAAAQGMVYEVLGAQVKGQDEQSARLARYQALRTQMNQEDVLMLAHHADDQAETVLMRLMDGAGVKGLSGMQSWHVQTTNTQKIALWRPWLSVRRAAISGYAQRLQLPYIDDPTNESGDNVRSGLRREILPMLARYNPNVVDNIARSASLLSDAHRTVSAQAVQDHQQVCLAALTTPPVQRALDIDKLIALPASRQRQLLHFWLALDEPLPPSKQLIDDVQALVHRADHNHQTRLDWHASTRTYSIRRYRTVLYRISSTFFTHLQQPVLAQRLPITEPLKNDIASMTLQANADYTWQLHLNTARIHALYPHITALTIAPLTREQRLVTAFASRPQSGKKLFQTLGIPQWLRGSLVVVSAKFAAEDEAQPLWLLSPFTQWALIDHLRIADHDHHQLLSSMDQQLQLHLDQ